MFDGDGQVNIVGYHMPKDIQDYLHSLGLVVLKGKFVKSHIDKLGKHKTHFSNGLD